MCIDNNSDLQYLGTQSINPQEKSSLPTPHQAVGWRLRDNALVPSLSLQFLMHVLTSCSVAAQAMDKS